MSYYQELYNELSTDPLARGYSGMTDQEAANSLNTVDRTRVRDALDSSEIYEAIDVTEFQALTVTQKEYVRDILGLGSNVFVGPGSKARTVVLAVFGAQSNTVAALVLAATENISRATELGFPFVKPGHVADARLIGA